MPSSSALSEYTFKNLGPLITTWKAPPSCATATDHVKIGSSADVSEIYWDSNCTHAEYNCIPTGTSAKRSSITGSNPANLWQESYFSPGLYCPSGWTTAGIASRDGANPVNSSGAFVPTPAISTSLEYPIINPPANVLMQILDPSETAALCCPSSMTANSNIGCCSTLPEYKISTGCKNIIPNEDLANITRTFWYYGVTAVGEVKNLVSTAPITSTSYITWHANATSQLQAYSVVPIVTLVHQTSDVKAAGTGPASTDSEATGNSAKRTALVPNVWDGIGAIFAIALLGIALGAVIILPV
ncbi:hypothetical protein N7462_005905 [Penicillium macrosclerotiorum]|uniref:uncharacterized protein n=1 Tax=Penicillium macrosclerotiorum TaxID=303699 RepID=UPI0025483CE6|nr:uncharacterized protein N7462_005905 [Penicillium macrosclerotiorum]KAJ5682740.1 hypothetical protein N7462_005905 [Penicillium macrosclerotiorum]